MVRFPLSVEQVDPIAEPGVQLGLARHGDGHHQGHHQHQGPRGDFYRLNCQEMDFKLGEGSSKFKIICYFDWLVGTG